MGNGRSGGPASKVVVIGVVACLMSAACSMAVTGTPSTAPSSAAPSPTASAPDCLVGEAWDNYAEQAIQDWDQPAMEEPILAAGDTYWFLDAKSNPETQATQIDEYVAMGAEVIILRTLPDIAGRSAPPATQRAIDRAVDAGVAVIAYEYFVDSPRVLLVTFDQVEVGRVEARAILAARPKGNYVIIRGAEDDFWDTALASGIHEILQPAIDRGDIRIVAETHTVNWDPNKATEEMRSLLAKNHNRVDAVIAESDGMAGGAIVALKEVGLDGKVAVAGQGGDIWSFHNVALGAQTLDVWRDRRLMGRTAGDAAVALCKNRDVSRVEGTTLFSLPGHNQMPAFLLKPRAITMDNLNVVIDSGGMRKADVCASIDPSGAPPACR